MSRKKGRYSRRSSQSALLTMMASVEPSPNRRNRSNILRLVPGLLQAAEQHHRYEVADVERRGGGVEADIAGHDLRRREPVQPGGVGHLVDVAALVEQLEQVGLIGHDAT